MFLLISEWERSGMSQSRFRRSRKIPKSVFYYWVNKYKEQQEGTSSQFIPVKIKDDTMPSQQATGMIIRYPNGVQVTLDGQTNIQLVRELIHIF